MRTSRKIPNKKNHAIPKLFPESPPAQAWGCKVVATVGGLASPAGEQGAEMPLLPPFSLPASQASLSAMREFQT